MNERIKELAGQCRIETYGVNGELLEFGFDEEKFAELIVQECINAVYDDGQDAEYYQNRIAKRFGVTDATN